jgi:hypothetical protein
VPETLHFIAVRSPCQLLFKIRDQAVNALKIPLRSGRCIACARVFFGHKVSCPVAKYMSLMAMGLAPVSGGVASIRLYYRLKPMSDDWRKATGPEFHHAHS